MLFELYLQMFRLRLRDMRDEFSEEFHNPMDEAVDDVMQDISRRVENNR